MFVVATPPTKVLDVQEQWSPYEGAQISPLILVLCSTARFVSLN